MACLHWANSGIFCHGSARRVVMAITKVRSLASPALKKAGEASATHSHVGFLCRDPDTGPHMSGRTVIISTVSLCGHAVTFSQFAKHLTHLGTTRALTVAK